jgi:hypothetical protein
MKKVALLILLFLGIAKINAQEFDLIQVEKVGKAINWKPAKLLKTLSSDELYLFFLRMNSDRGVVQQLNVNAWAVCDRYKIDNYALYNYYYNNISRETYNKYCKEINALMLLDNVVDQFK